MPEPPARPGRRIGIWASDPITAAGLMALLPVAGFEPVAAASIDSIDALLVATDSSGDRAMQMLTASAKVEGVPVVWLHRRHDSGYRLGEPDAGAAAAAAAEELSVHEIGEALLKALLLQLDVEHPEHPDDTEDESTSGALTAMEREGLRMLAEGQDVAEIAATLFYSERTIKNAIARAVQKLGAANRSSAVAIALRRGYL